MTVIEFLRLSRANWLVILAAIVLGIIGGLGYSLTQPQVFTSTSTGFVVAGGGETDAGVGSVIAGSQVAQDRANAYIPIINSRRVSEEVVALSQMGLQYGDVAGRLSASVAPGSSLIVVSANASSPEKAQELANLALQATANVVKEIEGNSSIRVVPLEDAPLPGGPSSPNYRNNAIVGGFAGLVIGYLAAFLRRAIDVRVRTTKDVEAITKSGLLGIVPKTKSLMGENRRDEENDSASSEALRQLRTNLRFVSIDDPPKVIMMTSPNPQEGKSTLSSGLARSLVRSGKPTLVIDADLRRPTQSRVFGIDGAVGLSQVLSGQATLDTALHRIGDSELYVLPAGRIPPNPSELLGSERMARLLKEASQHFTVIVDAPPLLPVTDASLLSTVVDGTILVVKLGSTHREHVEISVKMLGQVGGKLLGTVLNQVPTSGVGSTYYGFGYGGYRQGRGKNYYYASSAKPAIAPPSSGDEPTDGGASRRSRRGK